MSKKHNNYNNNNRNSLNLHFNGIHVNVDLDRFGNYVKNKAKKKVADELLLEDSQINLLGCDDEDSEEN